VDAAIGLELREETGREGLAYEGLVYERLVYEGVGETGIDGDESISELNEQQVEAGTTVRTMGGAEPGFAPWGQQFRQTAGVGQMSCNRLPAHLERGPKAVVAAHEEAGSQRLGEAHG
jgi:hypothetical protein